MDYDITLVGRLLPQSKPFSREYEIRRFSLLFSKGFLFYASLNFRLFFFLLWKKTDIILANDLDTLLPAFLVSKLRGKKLVYDSHEYFTEAEGLTGRHFQKAVWLRVEQYIFPKLKNVYTVNESIASIYSKKYNVEIKVIRNVPILSMPVDLKKRHELDLPTEKKIILLQGAYIDPDRGGMELVQAMQYLEGTLLLIIGSGRDIENLKRTANELDLNKKIRFLPPLQFDALRHFTANADLGISIDKPLHLNYTYSLPNKLFDYIHAGLPVLVSNLPELKRIVEQYKVGIVCETITAETVANCIEMALSNPSYYDWKNNCLAARQELNWQNEEKVLKEIYDKL